MTIEKKKENLIECIENRIELLVKLTDSIYNDEDIHKIAKDSINIRIDSELNNLYYLIDKVKEL